MKSIKVTILDKPYPLRVEDSEEQTMRDIARYVDETFSEFRHELSKQPDSTVMVLAALSIAEELFEERQQNQQQGDRVLEEVNNSVENLLQQIRR